MIALGQPKTVVLPPYSNRGVTPRVTVTESPSDGPCFDAYSATVRHDPRHLIDSLEQALMDAGRVTKRIEGPPVRFYGSNVVILGEDGHRLVSVRYGGQNGTPFVEAKGAESSVVAIVLREEFDHFPARIDSAYDLRSPTAMVDLNEIALEFEARLGLKKNAAGADISNRDRGSTVYLGSRTSQAYVRIYEKGLQIAEEMGLVGDDIPDELRNWVRVELEYKPDKRPARIIAAKLSPRALWGCSPWTRDFAKRALSIDAERVKMSERRESNHERSMRHLFQQYGPTILEQVERLGSWDRFVEDAQERLGVLVPA